MPFPFKWVVARFLECLESNGRSHGLLIGAAWCVQKAPKDSAGRLTCETREAMTEGAVGVNG